MSTNPIEVRSFMNAYGKRYTYWRLREVGRLSVFKSLYLMWVAGGVK